MAFNTTGAQPSPLPVFGGWVTNMAPAAVPEGLSPDCQDVGFLPGSVYSRPCLHKVFNPPLAAGVTIVYSKSFVTSTGDIKNLYLASTGNFYVEDWTNSPGTASVLFTVTPGSLCKSVTAFGREWMAFSDGLHGTDYPRQYDGTLIRRVTQNGPGAPPSVTNLQLPAVSMVSSGNTLSRQNNIVTGATATAHGLKVGYQAQISNVPDSNATTVNQTNNSTIQTNNNTYWGLNSGQYRSNFNPGTSPLSAFFATGFGFTIPSTATILGVVASFGVNSQSSSTGTVAQIALWYLGAQEGTAKSPATPITTTITVNSYGGAADLWSAALTPAIVNDPSFGFAISCALSTSRAFLNFPFTMTVYYTLSGSGTVGIVSSIVINNEVYPGLALVTTTQPHGLIPGIDVSIVGVEPNQVATVSAAQWSSGKTTLTTNASHGLNPGAVIQIASVTTSTGGTTFSFNGTWTVESVPAPNQIAYEQVPITATDPDVINATANTGTVSVSWPIPDDTPTPTYFEVQSCPSPTTFYVVVIYSDGTWTSGTVGFIWQGTFYVTSVPSPTSFTYYQPGPNGATTAVGTVTPFGQATPGLHLFQWLFETDEGAITAPSPPFTAILNGGQYVQVTNAPIGPSNVVRRILQATGAQPDVPGELPPFFYIPVPGQLEGLTVSTSTTINDNVTTTAVFDFSDNTLYAAVGTSILGNNLVNQFTLEGALGFGYDESRLITWGQRNTIDNFLNLGFEGGYNSGNLNVPLGWTVNPNTFGSGALVSLRNGMAWQITLQSSTALYGNLSQPAYLDAYGNPILDGNTTYLIRFWAQQTGAFTSQPTIIAELSSVSASFIASVTININSTVGGYLQGTFSAPLPENVPSDLVLQFWAGGTSLTNGTVTIDDVAIINAQQPYLDNLAFASYVDNPEGFDGDTGQMQPTEDTHKLMGFSIIRGSQYWLTQDPAGRLHEVVTDPTSEPSGWKWNELAANCGSLSAFGLAISQADDQSAGGGDDWIAWPSEGGVMIFDGGMPEKISQEIQQAWSGEQLPGVTWAQINMSAATAISTLNDPVERILYFFLPTGSATTPNLIYPLNYKELNSARAIMNSPPYRVGLSGKLIVTDNTRKWNRWNLPIAGGARMYRAASGELTTVFYGGTFGNVYTLNPAQFTDDDFGQMNPYYVTHFHLDPEKQVMTGLISVRLLLAYMNIFITGIGNATYSFLVNNLTNIWPLNVTRTLSSVGNFDQECAGGQAMGNRIAVKIGVAPLAGTTDVQFNLQRFQTWWKKAKLSLRGAAA